MGLWKHECTRVIADRFINAPDCEWFAKTMNRVAAEELGEQLQSYLERDHYFVDFLRYEIGNMKKNIRILYDLYQFCGNNGVQVLHSLIVITENC